MTQAGASTDRPAERGEDAIAVAGSAQTLGSALTPADGRRHRPVEVTVVVVLTYAVGVLTLLFGIVFILLRYDADIQSEGLAFGVTLGGAITILFGFFTLALASLISRADRVARIILTVILALNIVWDVLIVVGSDAIDLGAIIDAVLVAVVIAVLWFGRAARFFRRPGA
ncbi:hypothetical protein ACFJGV_07385 [Cnuibacter sp. UC19_7]|uniref:hypothetical protein n=1 Tax=Cnuibacter sp. UC19_7 TaxID=3350166 RepID=UPI00366B3831